MTIPRISPRSRFRAPPRSTPCPNLPHASRCLGIFQAQALPAFMRPGGGMVSVAYFAGCDASTIAPGSAARCQSIQLLLGYTTKVRVARRSPFPRSSEFFLGDAFVACTGSLYLALRKDPSPVARHALLACVRLPSAVVDVSGRDRTDRARRGGRGDMAVPQGPRRLGKAGERVCVDPSTGVH